MTIFLTPEEVAELTGVRTGRGGKRREELQAQTLSAMGVPHFVNRVGRPIVARAVIEGGRKAEPERTAPAWAPSLAHA